MARTISSKYLKDKRSIRYIRLPNGCWMCVSHSTSKLGYPTLSYKNRVMTVARYMLEPISKNSRVLHTCKTRTCINPKHLIIEQHEQ